MEKKTIRDEIALAQSGDKRARNAFIKRWEGLIYTVAARFAEQGVPMDDLMNLGREGIDRALMDFDLNRGTKFITYARYWVLAKICRETNNTGRTMRLSVIAHEQLTNIKKFGAAFLTANGREPTEKEIAVATGIRPRRVRTLLHAADQRHMSYDDRRTIASGDPGGINASRESHDAKARGIDGARLITACLEGKFDITPLERQVIICRYIDGCMWEEAIRHTKDVTRSRRPVTYQALQAAERRALQKIREGIAVRDC